MKVSRLSKFLSKTSSPFGERVGVRGRIGGCTLPLILTFSSKGRRDFGNRFLFLILIVVLAGGCTGGKVDSLLKRAEELKGTRQFEEAVNIYKTITTKYPEDKKAKVAYLKMGDLYLYTLGDSKKAMLVYSKILEKWPFEDEAREASLRRAEML